MACASPSLASSASELRSASTIVWHVSCVCVRFPHCELVVRRHLRGTDLQKVVASFLDGGTCHRDPLNRRMAIPRLGGPCAAVPQQRRRAHILCARFLIGSTAALQDSRVFFAGHPRPHNAAVVLWEAVPTWPKDVETPQVPERPYVAARLLYIGLGHNKSLWVDASLTSDWATYPRIR
jgi:hypothetical protein